MNYSKVANTERAARASKRVRRPPLVAGQCWALKRIYTGSGASKYLGLYENCSKNARKGCLTCRWHADREEDAQRAKGT
jgi:hypothetical protein